MTTRTDTDHAGRTGATAEELQHHARAVKEDLRELGRAAKGVAQEKLGDVMNRATEYCDDGRQKSSEYYRQGKRMVAEVEDRVEGYIREKPLQSVLIAAGAGALLGFLLTRR